MDQKVTGWIDAILQTIIGGINKLFDFFGLYSSKYAGWIVGLIGLWLATKILNIKLNFGGGKRG